MNNEQNTNNTNQTPVQTPAPTGAPVQTPTGAPVQSPIQESPLNQASTEVPTVPTGNTEITVVNTERKKTSSIILVILVALLIAFVLNIDKVIEIYDNYTQTGNLTSNTNNENNKNLVSGYILIGENTSRTEIDKIKFYNFKRKEDEMTIIFNYESSSKYDKPSDLNIYIELYNADKELIYKELFDITEGIEKDTVRIYSLNVTSDVYQDAYFALARKYDNSNTGETKILTCKYNAPLGSTTRNFNIVYSFKDNGLIKYVVNKQIFNYDPEGLVYKTLENEYNNLPSSSNPVFQGGNLNYTIDFNNDLNGFTPLYEKGTLLSVIKSKEQLKEWECE